MAKIEIIAWYSIYKNDWFATSIVQAMLKVHFQWKWQSKIQGKKMMPIVSAPKHVDQYRSIYVMNICHTQ